MSARVLTRTAAVTSADPTSRTISYVLSTGAVARDGNTIATSGWHLDNYKANPVFLWAHDTTEPPIGRMQSISIIGDELRGIVEYAPADLYPFADTVFEMVRAGFLNAVSVSWNPIKYQYAKGNGRVSGAIDFLEQDLLEVSQVPVPSLTGALATTRASGLNVRAARAWAGNSRCSVTRAKSPIPNMRDFVKLDTRADREKYARYMAYETCRTSGVPVPTWCLPAKTREERAAIVQGYQRIANSR